MSTHFRPPAKDAMKNKLISSACMIAIITSLYATCYLWFIKPVDVDLTSNVTIAYDGESGSASVDVNHDTANYNQRKQAFMDTVKYQVSPNKNLENGDVITIRATFDKDVAQQYHFNPINKSKSFVVKNLPERISSIAELSPAFLNDAKQIGVRYLDENMKQILTEDFTDFYIDDAPVLKSSNLIYRVFLDAKNKENTDRIIDIYKIRANGTMNVSQNDEKLEKHDSSIYYIVSYGDINTSFVIKDENVFGEKLIYDEKENLDSLKGMRKVLNQKFEKNYTIRFLNQ